MPLIQQNKITETTYAAWFPSWQGRISSALPDFITAAIFLITWVKPDTLGEYMVRNLMLVMLLEFLVVHCSGFFGGVVFSDEIPRLKRTLSIMGLGTIYLLFATGFSFVFSVWWPALAMLWLLLGKISSIWFAPVTPEQERTRQMAFWGISAFMYIIGIFATTLLPVPEFGVTAGGSDYDIPGEGIWVDHPNKVIGFGALYFAALGYYKLAYRGKQILLNKI